VKDTRAGGCARARSLSPTSISGRSLPPSIMAGCTMSSRSCFLHSWCTLRMCWRNEAFCSHPTLPPPPTIIPCCLSASRPVIACLHRSLYRNNSITQITRRDLVFEEVGVKYLLAIVGQEPLFASDREWKLELWTHSTALNPYCIAYFFFARASTESVVSQVSSVMPLGSDTQPTAGTHALRSAMLPCFTNKIDRLRMRKTDMATLQRRWISVSPREPVFLFVSPWTSELEASAQIRQFSSERDPRQ
jgi:hypothetical protein